jgi:hypothetical protein
LEAPCLRDSYFRFKYSLNVANTGDVRTPQYIYKYGASYYIDGGDEGTSQIYSASSKQKTIKKTSSKSLIGIRPKEYLLNREGVEIKNKKLIIPETLNVSTDSLTEVKVVTCSACPGFGYVYTPGVATTESGRYIDAEFDTASSIVTVGSGVYFTKDDIGAKIIAPSIYNAYIYDVPESSRVSGTDNYTKAELKRFEGLGSFNLATKPIAGELVLDRVLGITTTIGIGTTYPHQIRLSNYDATAASEFAFSGSKIEIQFLNPNNGDDYGHWADFLIGVTDKKPYVSLPDTLNGFILPGAGTTSVLSNSQILYGEHTHSYAASDEDGVETAESYAPILIRMGIDYRIPGIASTVGSSGICSKVTVDVLDPLEIKNVNERNYLPSLSGTPPEDSLGRRWIEISGTGVLSDPSIDFAGGQIAIKNTTTEIITITNSKFVGVTSSYDDTQGNTFSYIQISQSLGSVGPNFTVLIRPVSITGNTISKQKLYNYNPWPLYVVAKLKDNAAINNISVKETIGDFQRTISPKWYVSSNCTVTTADGNADITGAAPTNFQEINRSSSALIDTQNDQKLRPYIERDTLYVGANSTETINMRKIFGPDRSVITPDNNNTEATFIIAKKIDGVSGDTGTIEASINFKEQ